ncbi:MAG: ABC transporter ATP-binding protein [Paludisphaera borealis]|uniref:ABC transporter ATP-binding protein n=1 Tax=Paludisphaera borealis TaxID=1387353 RepID=UPI0028464E3E|nr:ABC transporter ATP-binding protein [Paludisphaera borealis]MDR3619153.1 ABC transporter ATP-binding protein [Paludisphaera borealis]
MKTLRRIGGWLAPYKRSLALAFVLTAAAAVCNLPVPLLVQGLIDRVVTRNEWGLLPMYAVGLFAVFAAQSGLAWCNGLLIGRVGQGVVRDLRHALYERLQRLSLSYYDETPSGAILSRVMDDVGAIQVFVTSQTFTILTDLGTTLAIAGLLLYRDWRLAAVVLAVAPLFALNFRFFMKRIRATSTVIREKMDLIFGGLKAKLDGTIVIRAYAREPGEIADFATQLDDAHTPRVRDSNLGAAFANISGAIGGVGTAVVFAMGAYEVLEGRLTAGGAVSTAALAAMVFGPVARLADLAYVFEQAAASVDRLGEILDREVDVREPEPAEARRLPGPDGRARGGVVFDRVGFGYVVGEPVVWDVRLDVKPGMKVALVGPTGCGKSTLVNLLMRFYDPTWGEIRLDGVPVDRIPTGDLRRQIGVVLQDPVVFRLSLADNIRYGAPDATDVQVEAAAKAALVHGFAVALPEGYDTLVGEGGFKLSQGERQRLAIARAVCSDPALVILDEATSSLDTASEALIQAALANLLRDRTAIIIAHRLSTIVDADLIVVMDGGLIVQAGSHAQLLADRAGLYRRLCARQFGDPSPPPPFAQARTA